MCGMSQVFLERAYAEELDAADPLAGFRDRFALDDPSLVYLNGNSLGALPRATLRRHQDVIREEWGTALALTGVFGPAHKARPWLSRYEFLLLRRLPTAMFDPAPSRDAAVVSIRRRSPVT